ncbi:DNA/RNA polymerase, partial [Westerdykella ornata]
DCFYASVFENENPELRSLPLAVQQKQIVVTCNYEARRRGLSKLQLIKDAKRICPDVVIVLGEDLTRFRDASKQLYLFLRSFSWNQKVERLGFDEVFMDVSDIIDYNLALLNHHDLGNSFFCLSKNDPTTGFPFDASQVAGYTYPKPSDGDAGSENVSTANVLRLRLHLGSHLAQHLREALRAQRGYTCTAGVSTNKLLSKLVGNLHKPDKQTTLLPPYEDEGDGVDNVTSFIDSHEVGKIPGIGFKLAEKLRNFVLQPKTTEAVAENWHQPKQPVLVGEVKRHPDMSVETLERVLGGPGVPHGKGTRVWNLLNGCDDTPVGHARDVPRQISIEDSYGRLDSETEVVKQLKILSASLLRRMHADLTVAEEEGADGEDGGTYAREIIAKKRWLAFPKTIRLSTRPRPPRTGDGTRYRALPNRISRSAPMPNFVFSHKESVPALAERLTMEVLVPLFRKLHPEKKWDLSLVNVAATDMLDAASEKGGPGRNIKDMFRRQDGVLRQWRVEESSGSTNNNYEEEMIEGSVPKKEKNTLQFARTGSEDIPTQSQEAMYFDEWDDGDEDMLDDDMFKCEQCGNAMPLFAMAAHERWHDGQ